MRFKSVLAAFIFILFACFLALFIFVQTRYFGDVVTKVVTEFSEKELGTSVQIKSFTLSVFPPGLEINRVRIHKELSETDSIEAEFGKLGFYISLIEFEEKKLTFGEIRIADSLVVIKQADKTDEEVKEIDQKIIDNIFEQSTKLPVRVDTLLVENTRLHINHDLFEAKRLKVFKKGDAFATRFHLTNLRPTSDSPSIDELWGEGEITPKEINLYRLRVQHDVQTILLKGKVTNYNKIKGSSATINGEAQFYLKNLESEIKMPDEIQIDDGQAKVGFNLKYDKEKISGTASLYLQDIKSNLFFAEEVKLNTNFDSNRLVLQSLSLKEKKQSLEVLEPVVIFDFNTNRYLEYPIRAEVKNISLNNALRILGPPLEPLKGYLTGRLSFRYINHDLHFLPEKNFTVRDLGLVVGDPGKPFEILKIKKAVFNNSKFLVINNEFKMEAEAELPKSKLNINGFVSAEKVNFTALNSDINLEDFGNIAQLDIKGAGKLDVVVSGPLEKTVLNIKGHTSDFEILKYKLGEVDKEIAIDLDESEVIIGRMEAKYGATQLTGNGTINYDTSEIALGVSSTEGPSSDLFQILNPILGDLNFLPSDLEFKSRSEVDIFGKTNLNDLKIRAKVDFSDLTAYGENLKIGSFGISLSNQLLKFENFRGEKGKGFIAGDFSFGLNNKSLNLNAKWDALEFSQFNIVRKLGLNLTSGINGKISGSGTTEKYLLKLEADGYNTKTPDFKFKDSHISLDIKPDRVAGRMNLLGTTLLSDFNLALTRGVASEMKVILQSDNIKPLLVAVFGQHLESEEFSGRINFQSETSFKDGFNHLNLKSTLKELTFNHNDFNVNYSTDTPNFLVRDSVIQNWDLNIKDPDFTVKTKGKGVFGKDVSWYNEARVNSKIIELLFSQVLSAEGYINNAVRVVGKNTDFKFTVFSKSDELDLTIDKLPIPLNNLKYDILFTENRLMIRNISSSLDNGAINVKGDVFFEKDVPDVNLKFSFDKAEIPILEKSIINVSGEGIVLGNKLPYNVGGDLTINNAQIVNELNDFNSKSSSFSQIRFLPKNQESIIGKLFNLNVSVKADNPVRVTNSLMDVALKGEVRVFGNPSRLKGEGRLFIPVNTSRIFFKNNEYAITAADINFNPKKDITNPDFDIQASTNITSYKIYPKVYGDLEGFNFDLISDPPLPRSSILSLIAFGYTDEIQSSLEAKDQQSLTQAGVGSFVFDRFKISDILNKQFGLQVNLGTVFEQSGTDSLLSGRSQEGGFGQGGGLGKTRSATKIELKKRLDEALTLSVSSTMGGSIGQRQSMNLNYGISKKVQLEGVYELRTNEEGQEDVIDHSIGGDLKFRWTFK